MKIKVHHGVLLALGALLALGLPAQAAKKTRAKTAPPKVRFEKGKVYHYTVTSHEEFKETDKKGSLTQRAYDGSWKTDLICGEKSGDRTPVVVDTRLSELKLASFQKDGQEGPAQERAVLEKAVSGEEKRMMSLELLDDFGADEEGRGVAQGAYFHVLLGGFDATVLPQVMPKPNRPWTREKVYGLGKYTFTYKVSPKPETKLGQKCLVITGDAKVSSPEGKSEYPKSTKYTTKAWFSQTGGHMMVALEIEGRIQFYPQEERMKKVTVEFKGTDDLSALFAKGDQATKAFFDGLNFLSQKRTLAGLERFSTLAAYSSSDLAQGVHELLMDDLFEQIQPVYPQTDLSKVEPDLKADPMILERLIERAPESRLRAIAAYYLGLSKGARDVQLLTAALEDTSNQARWAASGALVQKLLLQGAEIPDTTLVLMFKSKDLILMTHGTAIATRTKREKLLARFKIKYEPCKSEKPAGYRLKEGESSIPASQVETWRRPSTQLWSTLRVDVVKEEFSQGDLKGHYGLYIPYTYCDSRRYPLIISLGGLGEGDELIGPWPKHVADKGYFVACPVSGGKFWWQEGSKIVLDVLADLKSKYNIDENRVYVMGTSNGALGAYFLATRYPDLFAGAAPIGGNPVDENTGDDDPTMLRNLRNVPMQIMHGEADPVIPAAADRLMKARLDSLGYSAEYKETPGLGHDLQFDGNGRAKEYLQAIAFFEKHVRDPFPKKVSGVMDKPGWRYWIRVDSLSGKASFEAEVKKNNEIDIKSEGLSQLTLYLNPRLVDLIKPVTVMVNGKQAYKGQPKSDKTILVEGVKARQDRAMAFWAKVPLSIQ